MTKIDISENNDLDKLDSRKKLNLLKKEVYESIAKEFDISKITAEKLTILKRETNIVGVDNLKNEVENDILIDNIDKNKILNLTSEKLDNLYKAITGAEKIINNEFIDGVDIIKIGTNTSLSSKLFPKLYNKATIPESKSDQIIGFCLGGLDSCSTTIKFLYDVGAGITLSPHHIYLIITGKGEYKKLDKKFFILALTVTIISIIYIIYYLLIL